MTANSITCVFCEEHIVWNESAGWLVSTDEQRFGVYGTGRCYQRPETDGGIDAGHMDEWTRSLRERFAPKTST